MIIIINQETDILSEENLKNIHDPERDIQNILLELEEKHNIKIIYAALHGSRLYQFNTEESDYNVIFIYVQNIEKYLNISEKQEDTLKYKETVYDFTGWDIRKALQLHHKSNVKLYELINSSTVYINEYDFRTELVEFDKVKLLKQYCDLADKNFRQGTKEIPNTLRLRDVKKYIYSLLFVLQWKRIYKGEELSFNIEELMADLLEATKEYVESFLRTYQSQRLQIGFLEISNINSYLNNQLRILSNVNHKREMNYDYEYFDWKFREIVKKYNKKI